MLGRWTRRFLTAGRLRNSQSTPLLNIYCLPTAHRELSIMSIQSQTAEYKHDAAITTCTEGVQSVFPRAEANGLMPYGIPNPNSEARSDIASGGLDASIRCSIAPPCVPVAQLRPQPTRSALDRSERPNHGQPWRLNHACIFCSRRKKKVSHFLRFKDPLTLNSVVGFPLA